MAVITEEDIAEVRLALIKYSADYSQRETAELIGVSQSLIHRLINGNVTALHPKTLRRLRKKLFSAQVQEKKYTSFQKLAGVYAHDALNGITYVGRRKNEALVEVYLAKTLDLVVSSSVEGSSLVGRISKKYSEYVSSGNLIVIMDFDFSNLVASYRICD
ncbi:helix-turn-helix domain-containing protein [Candidatus Woesearchaeota archaeon]|jgi:transcriptional regulator with XRE-family HTH domain|nr:helix-turn-helix domain-containing protein [Candidatus Woesearchaeota archaeon]